MRNIFSILIACLLSISLVGCQGSGISKQQGGTVLGGVTGALLGSQFGGGRGKLVAVGVGALAGSMIGNSIGKSLDERDKLMLAKSSQKALEFSASGNSVEWNNPDSGNHGSITPVKTYKDNGNYCREYYQEVYIGDQKQKAYGKACRQPDGQWKIVK